MGTTETKRNEANEMLDFEIDWDNVFALLEMIIGAGLFGTVIYLFVLLSFSF